MVNCRVLRTWPRTIVVDTAAHGKVLHTANANLRYCAYPSWQNAGLRRLFSPSGGRLRICETHPSQDLDSLTSLINETKLCGNAPENADSHLTPRIEKILMVPHTVLDLHQ